MKSRALASIALGAAVIFGATGCSMISPQATTLHYAAAEGINVPNTTGPVEIRNVYFVVGDDDSVANLVGVFVNPTSDDQVATLSIDGGQNLTVVVPAGETVSYGVDDQQTITGFTGVLGANVDVAFTSGEGQTETVAVPVLDGTLAYLDEAVPSASTAS